MRIKLILGWIVLALLGVWMPVEAINADYSTSVGPYNVSFASDLLIKSFSTNQSTESEYLNPYDPNSPSLNYTQYTLRIVDDYFRLAGRGKLVADGNPELVTVAIRRYNTSNSLPAIPNGKEVNVCGGERHICQTYFSTFHHDRNGSLKPGGYIATDLNSSTRVIIACDGEEGDSRLVSDLMDTMQVAPLN